MDLVLKILTLNCWGIKLPSPIGSKDRKFRMDQIAIKLAQSDYDLVALEEVWDESDFENIRDIVKDTLPYSYYFHSGYLGSGVCVFSAHQITTSLMHRYSLNGFAHHIHRGDWFGGKVVGMVQVNVKKGESSLVVNLYATHVHAEYSRANDLYWPHRLVQAFELSQFVKHTSVGAHASILVGDMNMEPGDLGYDLVLSNARLTDAWTELEHESDGCTCDRPDNIYTASHSLKHWPNGKRIDYIMYKTNRDDLHVSVASAELTMNKIHDSDINYSDHMALAATLRFAGHKDTSETSMSGSEVSELVLQLRAAEDVVAEGERRVHSDRKLFFAVLVAMLGILVYTVNIEINFPMLSIAVRFCNVP